jgi:hypothetical protein
MDRGVKDTLIFTGFDGEGDKKPNKKALPIRRLTGLGNISIQ